MNFLDHALLEALVVPITPRYKPIFRAYKLGINRQIRRYYPVHN